MYNSFAFKKNQPAAALWGVGSSLCGSGQREAGREGVEITGILLCPREPVGMFRRTLRVNSSVEKVALAENKERLEATTCAPVVKRCHQLVNTFCLFLGSALFLKPSRLVPFPLVLHLLLFDSGQAGLLLQTTLV